MKKFFINPFTAVLLGLMLGPGLLLGQQIYARIIYPTTASIGVGDITSAMVLDADLLNADISADANIAFSKMASSTNEWFLMSSSTQSQFVASTTASEILGVNHLITFLPAGTTSYTDAGVLLGNGTGAFQVTGAGTSGQVLTSNGAGVDPTFQGNSASLDASSTVASSTAFKNDTASSSALAASSSIATFKSSRVVSGAGDMEVEVTCTTTPDIISTIFLEYNGTASTTEQSCSFHTRYFYLTGVASSTDIILRAYHDHTGTTPTFTNFRFNYAAQLDTLLGVVVNTIVNLGYGARGETANF